MSELTMPIMKATTADLCYTHWFERQLELMREGKGGNNLYWAIQARMNQLIPLSTMAPFKFERYTTQ